jgi:hypothetical protein
MGVDNESKLALNKGAIKSSLHNIRRSLYNKGFPKEGPHPTVAVDVEIFLVPAMRRKQAVAEFFMEPPVPVTTVSKAVTDYFNLLVKYDYVPIAVFGGQSNPAKADTSQSRYKDLPEAQQFVETLFAAKFVKPSLTMV